VRRANSIRDERATVTRPTHKLETDALTCAVARASAAHHPRTSTTGSARRKRTLTPGKSSATPAGTGTTSLSTRKNRLGARSPRWSACADAHAEDRFVPPSNDAVKNEGLTYDLSVHGTDGPVVVSFPALRPGFDNDFAATLASLGIKKVFEPVRLARLSGSSRT
jgi:hypothetical protein